MKRVYVAAVALVMALAWTTQAASASADEALATWVPPSVLLAVALLFGGALWMAFTKRLDKMEETNTHQDARITLIEKSVARIEMMLEGFKERMPSMVSNDSLGRLGDRMDGRITNIAGELAVVKDRLARVER